MATNENQLDLHDLAHYINQARWQFDHEGYGRSFAFYLLILKINPNLKSSLKDEFSLCWKKWSHRLTSIQKHQELFESYRQGCEVFLDCDSLHVTMGSCLYQLGFSYGAIGMFRRALALDPHCHMARENLENTCRGLVESWHFPMLNDINRNNKFLHAITKAIPLFENKEVLDIGSGTSILSMCAAKCGANVFACEMSNIMHMIAEDVVKQNKFDDKIKLMNCKSTEIIVAQESGQYTIPNRVSLVVTETVDAGLFGEGIIETLDHAWKKLLKPGGRVIPSQAHLNCRVLQSEYIHTKHIHFIDGADVVITSSVGIHNLPDDNSNNTTPGNVYALEPPEPYTSEKLRNIEYVYLSDERSILHADFNSAEWIDDFSKHETCLSVSLKVTRCGYFDALAVYFSLFLDKEHEITIQTDETSEHCWDQAIYPIRNLLKTKSKLKCGNCSLKLNDKRVVVHENDAIVLNLTTHKDNLQLESVGIESSGCNYHFPQKFNLMSDCGMMFISTNEANVKQFNDKTMIEMFQKSLNARAWQSDENHILDMFEGLSPLTVNLCHEKTNNIFVHKCWHDENTHVVLQRMFGKTNFFSESLDIVEPHQKYNAIFVDVIEPSGLLRSQVLENLAQAKMSLGNTGVVFPHAVRLWTQCIHSEQLYHKCIVGEANTLGFDIADFINDFQVSTYCNLEVNNLHYEALSEPQLALTFNLNTNNPQEFLNMENSFMVAIKRTRRLTAVLSWFEIQVNDENMINTMDITNHWKQAAIILQHAQQQLVHEGESLQINASCKNSFIRLAVKK